MRWPTFSIPLPSVLTMAVFYNLATLITITPMTVSPAANWAGVGKKWRGDAACGFNLSTVWLL